ncbi:MAG: ComEC/Rec2 family competence protein, partial [Candidatus Levybacteria bacterium]|nr:ComEC/Rec2 family competence protein [Candidatus Levybacteria bacterium]
DDISTTIVAQVFTLPILIHSFGVYSLWSILVNALVLWTVPILMLIGGIASVLIFISSFFSIFLYLALPFLIYFERIVGLFGNLDGQLDLSLLPWQYLISYYLILFAFLLRLKKII